MVLTVVPRRNHCYVFDQTAMLPVILKTFTIVRAFFSPFHNELHQFLQLF